jgi:iron complex outermembrane receptor protein
LPGIRYNYDKKEVEFNRQTYGGLETSDPALIALKRAVYTDQQFNADAVESNFSGQFTLSYRPLKNINTFATYSTSYKPVGVNLGGLPTQQGEVMVDLARVKPEYVNHYEVAVKTNPTSRTTINLAVFNTDIEDYQTQVQTAEVGVNRGYLANAEKVRVRGAELEGNIRFNKNFTLYGAVAYTDGEYVSFVNAPVPLEETGAPDAFKDISGGKLPGISKWAGSFGGEILSNPGYEILNGRFGFRATSGLSVFVWGRNLLNKDYFEQLLPAAGNAGHYAGVLGDPRTYGITLRYSY